MNLKSRKLFYFLSFIFIVCLIGFLSWQFGLFSFATSKIFQKPADIAKLTAPFIKNEGQVDERVSYYLKTSKITAYFTKSGITFDFFLGGNPTDKLEEDAAADVQRFAFSLTFVGANPNVEIKGLEEQEGKVSYLVGNDTSKWKTSIPTYAILHYENLYPGINLEYDSRLGELSPKFIVEPNANYHDIKIGYEGIDGLKISEAGDLVIQTTIGEFLDKKPNIYQELSGKIIKIPGEFRLIDSNSFSFNINSYNQNYPVIIGP